MAPRFQTMPAPKTESAREAARTFYCELCTKGYARMPEYEAHLSSYEHTHNQRRKDAKQFHKNPFGQKDASKNEERDKKAAGMTSVKMDSSTSGTSGKLGGGFKKGGFKSAGFKKVGGSNADAAKTEQEAVPQGLGAGAHGGEIDKKDAEQEDEGHDQSGDYSFWCEKNPGYTYYDPMRPGGCDVRCPCRKAGNGQCSGRDCELCTQLGPLPG
ncbi:hypothetical protein, variant [Verruconis gallopava]|uniref:C2H2-type domain-containing protein n=1 Tax=Verruconis gallopava TaxID=253628 RepID=A0A0D2APC4_9PEZI|nr:uncharacterized protein PV09_01398 [Verruconis gallopava]XP_016218373.1 hypothetical protein, variant [Verruconis gallopava]KIW08503.1 hypothetical protein PV09_01398 [Verruconis gallopava]KIW08504.1 hypothetical protein, variant [Verruconis gallopava]